MNLSGRPSPRAGLLLISLVLFGPVGCSRGDRGEVAAPTRTAAPTESAPTASASPEDPTKENGSGAPGCLDVPEQAADGMTRVELWFGDRMDPEGLGSSLVVQRDIETTPSIATATLRAWIDGPTAAEKAVGAQSAAPAGTELLGIEISDGTAVVDMSSDFEKSGAGTIYEGAILEQLAGTITQFESVERASLKIDGDFKPYYMSHGFIVDDDHPLLQPDEERFRVAETCRSGAP